MRKNVLFSPTKEELNSISWILLSRCLTTNFPPKCSTATHSPASTHLVSARVYLSCKLFPCLSPIQIRAEQLAAEGWEYSPVFTMKFHAKERKMDLVRRRRWHRKMVQDDPSAPAVFHIDVGSSKDDDVRISNFFVEFKVFVFGLVGKLLLLIYYCNHPVPAIIINCYKLYTFLPQKIQVFQIF